MKRLRRSMRILLTLAAGIALTGAGLVAAPTPATAAFKFKKIVDSFTALPGGGGNFAVGLGDPPAVSGETVVFRTLDGQVWTATTAGRQKKRILRPGDRLPGSGGARFQLSYGTFTQIHGDTVVFVGAECFGCNTGLGLYTVPAAGGAITRLVDVNQSLPDDPAQKFARFVDDFHVNGDHVVFSNRDGRVLSVPLAGGARKLIAGGPSCVEPYCGFGSITLDSLDSHVLVKAGNGLSNARIVRRNRAGGLAEVVADDETRPPHTSPAYRFDPFHESFSLPVIDRTADHRNSVFKGESGILNNEDMPRVVGIYSRGTGGFLALADSKMRVPQGKGRFSLSGFVDSGPRSLAAANGIVIFRGVDAENKLGIYAVRASGGPITKIIAQGDPINGTTVDTAESRSLTFRRDGFDGTTLVFFAQYAGNTGRGFFSAEVVLP